MLATVPLSVGLWLVLPHCNSSIQEAEREMLPLWLRNGTEALMDAVNSCSGRLEAECPKQLNQSVFWVFGIWFCFAELDTLRCVVPWSTWERYLAHLLPLHMSLF